MFNGENNCVNHKDKKFLFYCFDDKSYLCEKCFREHKSHNVEIKEDIKKVLDFIKILNKSDSNDIKKKYEDIENHLKELKEKIEQILLEIRKISEKAQNFSKYKTPDTFPNMKHEDFENLLNCVNTKSKANNIINNSISFLNKIAKEFIDIPSDFKYINKEVSVVKNSNIYSNFVVGILLGKSNEQPYTLFDKNQNHFLIVDLNKEYYLRSIRIQVTCNNCCLKNFVVYIKENKDNESENWIKINDFIRKKENQIDQFESFEIGSYCRQVKFLFIDAWGTSDGNYILIKRIDFEVGE